MQIFSLLMQLFMGYIVLCLHLLKERMFFFVCILYLVFKFGLCVFTFPLLNFPQNSFSQNLFVFPIFIGEKDVFKTYVTHRGSCFLDSLFSLILYCLCFCLLFEWVVFVNTWQKRGDLDEMWESSLFCLGGVEIVFERGRQ